MTVGSVLARGVGKSPRGLTKRIGVVGIRRACGRRLRQRQHDGIANRFVAGHRPLQPGQLQHLDGLVAGLPTRTRPARRCMGGTLKVEGSTDLSAAADPQGEYETIAFGLERDVHAPAGLVSLVERPSTRRCRSSLTLRSAMPTVSSDGLTYTFTSALGPDVEHHAAAAGDLAGLPARHPAQLRSHACAERQPRLLRLDDRGLQGVLHRVRELRARRRAPLLARRSSTTA